MPLPDAVYGSGVGPIVVSLQMRGVRQKPEAMTATAGKAKTTGKLESKDLKALERPERPDKK